MPKRTFSQIKNESNNLIPSRRSQRGVVPPPRRYSPSPPPSPIKRRGRPTKRGSRPGRPRKNDNNIESQGERRKPGRPHKRAKVDNNDNNNNSNDNNNANNNSGDGNNNDENNIGDEEEGDNLDFLFDPNSLIMLSNASGYLQSQMEIDEGDDNESEENNVDDNGASLLDDGNTLVMLANNWFDLEPKLTKTEPVCIGSKIFLSEFLPTSTTITIATTSTTTTATKATTTPTLFAAICHHN
ncbi:hypothetical protein Glove_23g224 [Diversispora epigaea]|uniref:Uncharacterized protein n=1 Tax=Diversispora epigaea TaxID=1348612 RepID=A0A397JVD4_9GLOM|nr:hypothetical protein Glove_23g224 [Diversispora epigaea]